MSVMTSVTHLHAKIPHDTLALRLIILRHELGWSQRKACEVTGISFGIWQGMEQGRETRGLDRIVTCIASWTGYDRDWIMWGGTLEPTPFNRPGDGSVTREYQASPRLTLVRNAPIPLSTAA